MFSNSLYYRQRNVVERAINRLKQFRRIATGYEKLAANYTAMITIASIVKQGIGAAFVKGNVLQFLPILLRPGCRQGRSTLGF